MSDLRAVSAMLDDRDLHSRIVAAAALVGVQDPHYFATQYGVRVCADKRVVEKYEAAVDAQRYPGAHGRIGYDPMVITDALLVEVVGTVWAEVSSPAPLVSGSGESVVAGPQDE